VIPTQRSTLQFVTLDGVRIGLRFRHFPHDDRWRMWFVSVEGNDIAGPITLLPGVNFLTPYQYNPAIPPGELFVFSEDSQPPTKSTIDDSANLYYRNAVAA
jgi:hypothetical protein